MLQRDNFIVLIYLLCFYNILSCSYNIISCLNNIYVDHVISKKFHDLTIKITSVEPDDILYKHEKYNV